MLSTRKANHLLGQNIRRLRHQHGWTQTQLSRMIGIHLRYLQKIEGDGMNASFNVLLQTKRVFRCKWDVIFRGIS